MPILLVCQVIASVKLRDAARPLNAGRGSVVPYDFRRPTKLSRENVRMLQMAYETFARRLTTLLTSGLRQVCKVTIVDISQRSYEEYVTELEAQTLMVPISVPPLAGTGVLQFSLPTALASIDHMLGGPGGKQAPRTLTEIETTILRGLLDQMVGVLRYSFEPIVAINPTHRLDRVQPAVRRRRDRHRRDGRRRVRDGDRHRDRARSRSACRSRRCCRG